MNESLKKIIDEFLDEFKSHDSVKTYLLLKKKLTEDEEFLKLKLRKKQLQKELALSLNKNNYLELKKEFLKAEEEYNNYPLYLNYLKYQEEIKALLEEIELYLK